MAVKTYQKGDTSRLSKNFSVNEFRCGLGSPCSSCTTTLIDEKLVEYLQKKVIQVEYEEYLIFQVQYVLQSMM